MNDFTDLRIRKQNICVLVGVSLPARYTAFSQLRLAVGTIANNNRGDGRERTETGGNIATAAAMSDSRQTPVLIPGSLVVGVSELPNASYEKWLDVCFIVEGRGCSHGVSQSSSFFWNYYSGLL